MLNLFQRKMEPDPGKTTIVFSWPSMFVGEETLNLKAECALGSFLDLRRTAF